MVKNLLSNAGDAGLIPGQGTKNPHVAEQLSQCTTRELEPQIERLCITVTESACYNIRLCMMPGGFYIYQLRLNTAK